VATTIFKNLDIWAAIRVIFAKFGMVSHFDSLDHSDRSKISTIQDGGGPIFKN